MKSWTLDLDLVLDALRVRWWLFPLCALMTASVAYGAATLHKPKHIASAKVLIQENASVNPFLSDMMVEWSVKTRLPVITNVVRSRKTAERLLTQQGELTAETSIEKREAALKVYQRRLSIYSLGGGVVQLKYRGDSPDQAFEGIELLMSIFSDEMLRPQKQALDQSVAFLQEQLKRVRQDLHLYEQELRVFKEEHSDELPEVFQANMSAYLKVLEGRLETRAALAEQSKSLKLTKERLLTFNPQAQKIEGQLLKARQKLASLKVTLHATHPRVQAVQAHVTSLERSRSSALARSQRQGKRKLQELESMASLSSDARVLQDKPVDLLTNDLLSYRTSENVVGALTNRLSMMDTQAKQTMGKVRAFAKHEQTMRVLERDIETKTKVYTSLLQRYENALVTRELALRGEASRVWVIEPPMRPSGARVISPSLAALAGVGAGLALALMLMLVLEFLSREVRRAEELEGLFEAPSLLVMGSISREAA